MGDAVALTVHEVEGIAYGLLQTLFQIFKHMYKAADRHVETLDGDKLRGNASLQEASLKPGEKDVEPDSVQTPGHNLLTYSI